MALFQILTMKKIYKSDHREWKDLLTRTAAYYLKETPINNHKCNKTKELELYITSLKDISVTQER